MLLFTIDSRDRIVGTSTDFTIQLATTLNLDVGHQVSVAALRVPLVIPTIQRGVNDCLVVTTAGGEASAYVGAGQVNGSNLALKVLEALCRASPSTEWRVEYANDLLAMAIEGSEPFTLQGSLFDQLSSRPFEQTPTCYRFLYVPVQAVDVVYLCCPDFANFSGFGPNGSADVVLSAAVDRPFGDVLLASTPPGCWLSLPRINTQTLSFQLRDRNYKILDIVPNISFDLWVN